jgi:formate transporter
VVKEVKQATSPKELHGFNAYSPHEVARKVGEIGVAKVRLPFLETFMLGVLAGGFIGLGGLYYTLVTSDGALSFAVNRLLGGAVFSMGYIIARLETSLAGA